MMPRIRFCRSADGARIAFGTVGSGPPILAGPTWLTHLEFDWDVSVWKPWYRALSANHTLVRFDLRGCGLSDRNVEDFSIDRFVDDMDAVADAMQLDRFPLVGICQGGPMAAAYAAHHPERVNRLLLYGSYAQGGLAQRGDPSIAEEVRALALLIERGWGQPLPAFRELFARLLIPDGSPEMIHSLVTLEKRSATPLAARDLWLAFHRIDIAALAPKIKAPTLVVHCRDDAMVPFSQGRLLATLIPGAQFLALEGRNHILQDGESSWRRLWDEAGSFLSVDDCADRRLRDSFSLTRREQELLDLLAQGRSNAEIGAALGIAPKTVRNHVSNIFDKLSVSHRAEAVVRAREAGFGNGSGHLSREVNLRIP